jgi:biotin carboxyl carrier protein
LNTAAKTQAKSGTAVAAKWTYAVLGLALLFVLMPFLFWRATWFGRPLTDAGLAAALKDASDPREIQHGLSQLSDRIVRGDPAVKQFYPQVLALASSPHAEIRVMDAWVMGQDNSSPEFHQALLRLLHDPSPLVQRNAALGLVRFQDASGRRIIVNMLEPDVVRASRAGILHARAREGESVSVGDELATIQSGNAKTVVSARIDGRIGKWLAADGALVAAGQPLIAVLPSDDTVWEALRALYLIGTPEDLEAIAPYARDADASRPQIAEQARLTMEEIRSRIASEAAPSGTVH